MGMSGYECIWEVLCEHLSGWSGVVGGVVVGSRIHAIKLTPKEVTQYQMC